MIRRLIILLLIVGCEETTAPEDCAGVLGGDAMSNECGYCVGGSTELHNNYCGNITDLDGNIYNTVKIGEQKWMAENLKVTSALITDSTWCSYLDTFPCIYPLNTSKYSFYNHSEEYEGYGLLYERDVCSSNVCPEGWRIPYSEDFWELFQYLSNTNTDNFSSGAFTIGDSTISQKLRITGYQFWGENNTANNISGFSAIASGIINTGGFFLNLGYSAHYWNYTYYDFDPDLQYYYLLQIDSTSIFNISTMTNWTQAFLGGSIRCIKD